MTIVPSSPDTRSNAQPPTATDKVKTQGQLAVEGKAGQGNSRRASILSVRENASDLSNEATLRPRRLDEYEGQGRLKSILQMSIAAAKSRGEPLDHILFYGPPGLGKTTLAKVVAHEMGAKIQMTSGPALERPRDIIGLIHQLEAGDILFIDEIHRLNRVAEELLYPAIEDFILDLNLGKGQSTRSMRLNLPKFTLIGATTKAGTIANALRDRFGFTCRLEFYSVDELSSIVARTARILTVVMEPQAVRVIAARARGTPRVANRLVRLVRDYAHFVKAPNVDEALALAALDAYQVDEFGLDATDRRLLEILVDHYGGGPVGLETLAATIGEDKETLEEVYEPFLIQIGFLNRTQRGRMATANAFKHLKRPVPPGQLGLDLPLS